MKLPKLPSMDPGQVRKMVEEVKTLMPAVTGLLAEAEQNGCGCGVCIKLRQLRENERNAPE